MAIVHNTTLTPSKLELLTSWLPTRPWYSGGAGGPRLAKAGGFRLDDPAGAVGIEFMVVTDTSADYLVPLTYRGAPLAGAESALIGTMEHGVLGPRWAYDGCQDPVAVAQLVALIEGRVQAQAQSLSDTPDRNVTRSYTGAGPLAEVTGAVDDSEATVLGTAQGSSLRLHRVLRPTDDDAIPPDAIGHVSGTWRQADGTLARAVFVIVRPRS